MPGALVTPLLVAALSQAAAPGAELRTISVAVTDAKGQPLSDLALSEVALLENGVARDIAAFERDERPLTLAVLVDNSEPVSASYKLNVVDAVLRFLGWLPSGTRYTLWTTGDRPEKILELTSDRGAATQALKRTHTRGGNTLLDALVEASRDLRRQEGARSAVVAVTGMGVEFSNRPRESVVEDSLGADTTFMAVQFEVDDSRVENRHDYDYVLGKLADKSGGLRESVLTAMAVETALRKLAGDIASRYRLSYATLPELKKRKLEVQVARPGARTRVAEAAP
jgi:VWFA-related protein